MSDIDATLAVYGAVAEDNTFDSWDDSDLAASSEPVEVFIVEHEHEPSECACVQFLTDHSPYWQNATALVSETP